MTTATKETLGFQAEIKQLLNLIIHSLYSNKDVFLRELISNASDAADKLRFLAIENNALYENDSELMIWVTPDAEKRTISIRDNGVGMTREEIATHLGTIAKSGTRDFLAQLSKEKTSSSNLIGQFGVGFYSAFLVADKVTVNSRRAGLSANEGVCWESDGSNDFTVESIHRAERGTEVILHLKEEDKEYADEWRLRHIISTYSNHIGIPVKLAITNKEKNETTYETINNAKALWKTARSELKDTDYIEFYKQFSHDYQDPLAWSHNHVEGKLDYTSLLYIPAHAPFDLWNRDANRGLKLYVQRVFIMDHAEQFLPGYLRFVAGILDSNDLPLNVSRETLQTNKAVESIKNAITKRVLDTLEKLSTDEKEKYKTFWKAFGNVMKEGVVEDMTNRERIAKLLRFSSTHESGSEQTVSLEDYCSRMKPEQQAIYFLTAESLDAARHSPHLEIFHKKGIEVLLLTDRIDEWLVSHLTEFNGKSLKSISKGNLDLGSLEDSEDKKKQEEDTKTFESFLSRIKTALGDRIKEVRTTRRLTQSPCCVVVDDQEMNFQLQKMLQAAGHAVPEIKPTLEINPEHALIRHWEKESDEARFKEWADLFLEQSILAESGQLKDPSGFVQRINQLMSLMI